MPVDEKKKREEGKQGQQASPTSTNINSARKNSNGVTRPTTAATTPTTELLLPVKYLWKYQRINFRIRAKLLDLVLFLPAFFVLMGLCYYQYTSRSQSVFYGNDAMVSQFMTDEFPTLNSTRPLRNGEVDKYHVLNTFEKLNYIDDWKVWIDTKIIGFLWDSENPSVAVNPQNTYNFASGVQALKVGAMQIRVIRTQGKKCKGSLNNMATRLNYSKCVESFSVFSPADSVKDTFGPMKYQTCDPSAFLRTEGRETFYWCDGNVLDIPFSSSYDDAITLSNSLHNSTFSILKDPHVRLIAVELFMYFPATDTLSHYQLLTELPVSGSIITSFHLITIPMYRNLDFAVVMILGFVGVALLTVFRDVSLHYTILSYGMGNRVGFILTWIPVLIYTILFLVRMSFGQDFALNPNYDEFPSDQLSLASMMFVEKHVLGVCLLALFGRLMNLMSILPMLRLITRTIKAAVVDLIALICVFVVIFVTYALAGTILYSDSSPDWRSYGEAFGQTVLWVLGEADYAGMRQVNIPATIFYFWSYTILVIFILLNFFVGVLEYAYGNTISKEGLTEDSETSEIIQRELKRLWMLGRSLLRRDFVPLVECAKSLYDQQQDMILGDIFAKEVDKEAAIEAVRCGNRVIEFPREFGGFTSNAVGMKDIQEEYERRKAMADASPLLDKYVANAEVDGKIKLAGFRMGERLKRFYWRVFVEYPAFDKKFVQRQLNDTLVEFNRQQKILARSNIREDLLELCLERWNSDSVFMDRTEAEQRDLSIQVSQVTFGELLSVLDPTLKLSSSLNTDTVTGRIKAWIRDPSTILSNINDEGVLLSSDDDDDGEVALGDQRQPDFE